MEASLQQRLERIALGREQLARYKALKQVCRPPERLQRPSPGLSVARSARAAACMPGPAHHRLAAFFPPSAAWVRSHCSLTWPALAPTALCQGAGRA